MKTIASIVLTIILFVSVTFSIFSQSDYETAMREGLDSLNHIRHPEGFQHVANHFERIANVEANQWLPGYYAAYCYIILSFHEQDPTSKEKLLTESENLIDKILQIKPDESEIYVLQGMLYQSYISVDPQNNAPVYSARANQSFEKSMALDAGNPRPYYLMGMNLMYTPEAYGGGMKVACPLFAKANELFGKYEKENDLMPDWGNEHNAELLGKCEEK